MHDELAASRLGVIRGCAKKKNSRNPTLLGWVGLTRNFVCFGKSSQNTSKSVHIFWSSIPYVFTLLKCDSYYDLSVLSMSVMGFQKKFGWGVGGWRELYPSFFF